MSERHLSRKEIKHDIREDKVRTTLEHVFIYLAENTWVIAAVGGGILALIGIVIGVGAYRDRQLDAANEVLGQAIRVYAAPIDTVAPKPDDRQQPTFASTEERNARARELFEQVRREHGGSGPDMVAAVYLGRIHLQDGDEATARELWNEAVAQSDDVLLSSMVTVSLLALDREAGQGEQVVTRLQAELDAPDRTLPTDILLFELAVTFEDLERTSDAQQTFQRLSDEYPESPYAQRALTRATEIGAGV